MQALFHALAQHGGIDAYRDGRLKRAVRVCDQHAVRTPEASCHSRPATQTSASISPEMQSDIERRWLQMNPVWHNDRIAPTHWQRARTRPANHAASRLMSLAALLDASRTDLLSHLTDALRYGNDLPGDAPKSHAAAMVERISGRAAQSASRPACCCRSQSPTRVRSPMNQSRKRRSRPGINCRQQKPAVRRNAPRRRSRDQPGFVVLGERGQQGLLYLDRNLCTPRRCFECPIAAEVIRSEQEPGD